MGYYIDKVDKEENILIQEKFNKIGNLIEPIIWTCEIIDKGIVKEFKTEKNAVKYGEDFIKNGLV